jgi:hypothetical protein
MSGNYNPDDDAEQQGIWGTVFLSNRDLSSQIPVNFVTHPGVSLTSACFSNGTYTAGIAEKCVSNLLAAQFRRLVLDLYWDENNNQFAFCPVTIPVSLGSGYETVSLTASAISSASLKGTARLAVRQTTSASGNVPPSTATTTTVGSSDTASITGSNLANTTTSASPANPTLPTLNGETLYDLGPYACSPKLDLSFFISVMSSYLSATSDTIQAKLIYLEINLHAAASNKDPTGPASQPSSFPGPEVLVGNQFAGLDHSPIYRPSDLEAERSNLNNTWFRNPEARWPIAEYFKTEETSSGDLISSDGWPDENYVQLTLAKRVFLGWGTIDPQMSNYNFSGDASTVFANGQLSASHETQADENGKLTSGCFYNPSQASPRITATNSSWDLTTFNSSPFSSPFLPTNLTSCGISPLLNVSLTPLGASHSIAPFLALPHSSIWNWAPSEPRNTSAPGTDLDAPESQYRCAYLEASTTSGRWFVQDCLHSYRVACRMNNQPYQWILSEDSAPYASAPDICPQNSSFDVPRTGLENRYLFAEILSVQTSGDSSSPKPPAIWINFNSLDVPACWVTTGPNGTCPYFEDRNMIQNRQVLVPTIAAIIVLILTALTLFVKCNVNRRKSRTRRRGEGGWDYEGVPS